MPNRGSWNGHWSGENDRHIIIKNERYFSDKKKMYELVDKDYWYRWNDGWSACISVSKMPAVEARKLKKKSSGFCGYDWMVESIIEHGKIQHR